MIDRIDIFGPQSPFPQGEVCQDKGWHAVLPDPDYPGKYRMVEFVRELRMEMLPGFVTKDGNREKPLAPALESVVPPPVAARPICRVIYLPNVWWVIFAIVRLEKMEATLIEVRPHGIGGYAILYCHDDCLFKLGESSVDFEEIRKAIPS